MNRRTSSTTKAVAGAPSTLPVLGLSSSKEKVSTPSPPSSSRSCTAKAFVISPAPKVSVPVAVMKSPPACAVPPAVRNSKLAGSVRSRWMSSVTTGSASRAMTRSTAKAKLGEIRGARGDRAILPLDGRGEIALAGWHRREHGHVTSTATLLLPVLRM
jgi:hypothetical protein